MFFRIIIFLVLCFCSFYSFAIADTNKKLPVGSTNHPKANVYWPFIARVYASLGYEVELIEAPAARGLDLLSKGKTLADVARLGSNIDKDPNLIKISPALTTAKVMLLCIKDSPCSISHLAAQNGVAFTSQGVKSMIQPLMPQVSIVTMEAEDKLIELLRRERVKFVIFVDVKETLPNYRREFEVKELHSVDVYHVIHRSLAPIQEQISEEIINQLPWFELNFGHMLETIE